MADLPHVMMFEVGDWSCDGHSQMQGFTFQSSHSAEEIGDAYRKSCKATGIVFHKKVASSYGDRTFPAQRFLGLGCPRETVRWVNNVQEEPATWCVCGPEHLVELLKWFCSLSLPGLELEEDDVRLPDLREHCAPTEQFGYGLFD